MRIPIETVTTTESTRNPEDIDVGETFIPAGDGPKTAVTVVVTVRVRVSALVDPVDLDKEKRDKLIAQLKELDD
ncbi:hypothetical protein [Oharaeibacter diazotrophicus]|uniref:hypothetical protein n=1 Tax=Oharaeibacter diazotrophicus TaxID=1920512 RepID=UPI000F81F380|nr:hypothetical protein [Oharaeibacter diazotrophicus]GLS74753.1 hypothetical protein GCM10007904_00880 [Oharaeibacter diazotrophicus]